MGNDFFQMNEIKKTAIDKVEDLHFVDQNLCQTFQEIVELTTRQTPIYNHSRQY